MKQNWTWWFFLYKMSRKAVIRYKTELGNNNFFFYDKKSSPKIVVRWNLFYFDRVLKHFVNKKHFCFDEALWKSKQKIKRNTYSVWFWQFIFLLPRTFTKFYALCKQKPYVFLRRKRKNKIKANIKTEEAINVCINLIHLFYSDFAWSYGRIMFYHQEKLSVKYMQKSLYYFIVEK